MRPSTTGRIRSTHRAYWAPTSGWSPSVGDERPIRARQDRTGRRCRRVGDPALGREPGHRLVRGHDRIVLLARIAVIGAGRGDGVKSGVATVTDAVRREESQESVEDRRDISRIRRGRRALDERR